MISLCHACVLRRITVRQLYSAAAFYPWARTCVEALLHS